MPDNPRLETFTAGVETAVDVAQIERQLHELWQLAAESHQDPAQRQITRACLLSFIVFCGTDAEVEHATETVSTLTSRHPCRAIVLLAREHEPDAELSASISAHCHLAGSGRKQVCCEQISIHASGESTGQLASAVLPLLESDLPTVIWWQGNFLARPSSFPRLIAVADRLIYDTATWGAPELFLGALSRIAVDHPHCRFADLNWTRLEFWRKLTAECFDDPPCRAMLERIRSVVIAYGSRPGGRLRALLYGGWLAAQLRWTPQQAAAKIRLSGRTDKEATATGLLSVELEADGAAFCIRKNPGELTASARVTMPCACGLPRKRGFWPADDASLLSQELDRSAPDSVYQWALAMAAALVTLLPEAPGRSAP
ncbi:MAG TPA: glucose-6-phosphate dehydrogenase assembly protein OpcA [Verrucomicrobiae bacterium]|nr:glucose-6-phosphate dehydrogenase assembly protein OpcA [Verrucomicrobiae bacterium]